jgi:hypothetical protein
MGEKIDLTKAMKAELEITETYTQYRLRQLLIKLATGTITEKETEELWEILLNKPHPRPIELGVRLTTILNTPIKDAEVKFTVAGEIATVKTDATGFASIPLKNAETGNIAVAAKAAGHNDAIIKKAV